MKYINPMKNLLIIFTALFIMGCEKNDFDDDILIENEEPITQIPETLYGESYLNQRSGISFLWGGPAGGGGVPTYITNMGNNTQGPYGFNQGNAYYDVNDDGYVDILASTTHDIDKEEIPSIDWYINQGDNKNFRIDTSYIAGSTIDMRAHKILKTDVNNDGRADFIILGVDERVEGAYGGNFTVLIQNSTFKMFTINEIDSGQGLWYHNGAAGDINGDGNIDVVAAQYIWYGDGNGNFTNTLIELNKWTDPILSYEILDLNSDGYNDIIVGTHGTYQQTSTIIWGSSVGFDLQNKTTLPETNSETTFDLEFMDIDNDGDMDIIEGRYYQNTAFSSMLVAYINNEGEYSLNTSIFEQSKDGSGINSEIYNIDEYGWTQFKIDDIDNDGIDDIIAENFHDGKYNGLKLINGTWTKHRFN
jgi:hypothetical protein|tara:strand:+ start:76 stop:1329 length:1254 start_codon:yes stop_codon:yes gene_type:complete